MAVGQGSQQAAIDKSWKRHVIIPRRKMGYNVFTFDVALQLVAMRIMAPTAEAVRQIVRV
jgi:hypothetical protein